VGWARWSTYDLGCGGGLRDPYASADTWWGDLGLQGVQVLVAVTSALAGYAFDPGSWLGRLDPVLERVSGGLVAGFTTPVGPLLVITAGLLVISAADRSRVGRAVTLGVGVVAGLTVVFFAAGAPVAAGGALDAFVASTSAQVNTDMTSMVGPGSAGPAAPGPGTCDPGAAVVGPYTDHVLYRHWLAGTLGSATSPTAVRYGPVLLRAQAVSWAEADAVRGDPAAARALVAAKQASWKATAARVQEEDPDAYAYLSGTRPGRTGHALLALAAALPLLLALTAFGLMITAYLVVRTAVMTAPAWAVVAVLPAQQKLLRQATALITTAVFYAVTMAALVTVTVLVTGHLQAPATGLGWLGDLLSVIATVAAAWAVQPLHLLASFITAQPTRRETRRKQKKQTREQILDPDHPDLKDPRPTNKDVQPGWTRPHLRPEQDPRHDPDEPARHPVYIPNYPDRKTDSAPEARSRKAVKGFNSLSAGGTHSIEGRLSVVGGGFSDSERFAAEELRRAGREVVLREATGRERTSDLLVDGIPYDVYTPRTSNINRIVSAISSKSSQVRGGGVVLDLTHTVLTKEDMTSVLPRVRGVTTSVSEIIVIGE
jgi:Contact-dependent growth inhibition CdiA C-terminal domain